MTRGVRVATLIACALVVAWLALDARRAHTRSHCGLLLAIARTPSDSVFVYATNAACLHTWKQ